MAHSDSKPSIPGVMIVKRAVVTGLTLYLRR